MVRSPCCDGDNLKKGPWTPEEDERLVDYISRNGRTNWKTIPKLAGLSRCGKSCRLRWTNYLRPDIKRGKFTDDEERLIINLHSVIGNKWSRIAIHLPGRTDNEIKNFWNTHIRKKLLQMGIDPITHKPRTDLNHFMNVYQLLGAAQLGNKLLNPWDSNVLKLQADDATQQLARLQVLQNLLQIMNTSTANHTNTTSLLGSQNLTNPVQELLGPTNFYPTDQPHTTSKPLQFLFNPCGSTINPQAAAGRNDDLNAVMNSWAGESDHLRGGLQIEDSSNNNILSSFYNIIAAENELPELVLASTAPETSIIDDQMRRKFNNPSANNSIIGSPTASTAFEDWEKLIMDDNETDTSSYWKDILDFTSSPPSPI